MTISLSPVSAREAEVGDLGLALGVQEHVLGLEVAVDDALLVGEGDALEDRLARARRRGRARGAFPPAVSRRGAEVAARAELEDEEGRILVEVLLEDLDEARPLEAAEERALAAEGRDELGPDRRP